MGRPCGHQTDTGFRCALTEGHDGEHVYGMPYGDALGMTLEQLKPDRAEIAARILAGIAANPAAASVQGPVAVRKAVELADLLIERLEQEDHLDYRQGQPRSIAQDILEAVRGYEDRSGLRVRDMSLVRREADGNVVDVVVRVDDPQDSIRPDGDGERWL